MSFNQFESKIAVFLKLDDLLCSINVEFCRKSDQTVRDHLLSLQKPLTAPLAGSEDVCDKVILLYEHARYGKKVWFYDICFS